MPTSPARLLAPAGVVTLSLALAACGGDGGSPDNASRASALSAGGMADRTQESCIDAVSRLARHSVR